MAPLVWLITGCSSGLGECLARKVLARGDFLIATARKIETLNSLTKAGASPFQLDITASQETINATVKNIVEKHGHVDVLVNNAANVVIGAWEDLGAEGIAHQFDTNVFGTIKVTNAMMPYMRERKSGSVVFISSEAGWVADGFVGAYNGSKFALEGLAEAFSKETQPLGIRTLLIEPGRFRTKLLSTSNVVNEVSKIPDYADASKVVYDHIVQQDGQQAGDPEKCVEIIVDLVRGEGIAKGKMVPLRMPLGNDVYDRIKEKCEDMLKLLDDWKEVIISTDLVDA